MVGVVDVYIKRNLNVIFNYTTLDRSTVVGGLQSLILGVTRLWIP